ncbi:hypothetical protein [Nonomuraea sp. CA-141351]|uniref:hypothetical protein n=1 Tax=Nonomuraea sp. CA-141351 TaxID=3239996 RepID=UPI003D8BFB87
MSNGARHALGVLAGLLLPPLVAAGLWYGVGEILVRSRATFQISWLGLAVVAASGLVLAFLAGSRLSPIASLLGGLAFTALGILPTVELQGVRVLPGQWLPATLEAGFQTVAYSGVLLFLGVALLVVSMFPSRWRSSAGPAEYSSAYGSAPSPYLPQSGPEDATRPMYRE